MTTVNDTTENNSSSAGPLLLKALDSYDILFGQPLRILRQNWKCFLGIAFAVTALEAVLQFLCIFIFTGYSLLDILLGSGSHINMDHTVSSFNSDYHRGSVATLCLAAVNTVIVYGAMCWAKGAIVYAAVEMHATTGALAATGSGPSMRNTLTSAAKKWKPLLLVCLCISLVRFLWKLLVGVLGHAVYTSTGSGRTMVLFVGFMSTLGAFITVLTYFVIPVVMVEPSRNAMESLQRSFGILKMEWRIVLVIVVVYRIIKTLLAMGCSMLAWKAMWNHPATFCVLILTRCINASFLAIDFIVASVAYLNARVKHEQLTPEMLAAEMGLAATNNNMNYTNMEQDQKEGDAVTNKKQLELV